MNIETKVIERKGNHCKTTNGNVYRVKVGLLGSDYGLIGNTKLPLDEYLRGKFK